jgi:hypothetical protein
MEQTVLHHRSGGKMKKCALDCQLIILGTVLHSQFVTKRNPGVEFFVLHLQKTDVAKIPLPVQPTYGKVEAKNTIFSIQQYFEHP